MTAPRRQTASGTIQAQILEQLREVKGKVDESLKQGADNGKQIELIRLALGMDGAHGLLPELEKAIVRIDKAQETDHRELCLRVNAIEKDLNSRIDALEKDLCDQIETGNRALISRIEPIEAGDQQNKGRKQLWDGIRSFLWSSAGAATVAYLAKVLGLIH